MTIHNALSARSGRAGRVLAILLMIAIVAAMLPQSAQAAPTSATCARYYTIKEGDTTQKIAQTFGLKWRVIAVANKMYEDPYILKAGEQLCIPPKPTETSSNVDTAIQMTVRRSASQIVIEVSNISSNRHVYYVKIGESNNIRVSKWYKMGTLRVQKKSTVRMVLDVPEALRSVPSITVCLKNGTTDQVLCKPAIR